MQHFKIKLKTPRKSHYKKDDKAVDTFFTPPNTLQNIRLSLNKDKYIVSIYIFKMKLGLEWWHILEAIRQSMP